MMLAPLDGLAVDEMVELGQTFAVEELAAPLLEVVASLGSRADCT